VRALSLAVAGEGRPRATLPLPQVLRVCCEFEGKRKVSRVFQGLLAERPFYSSETRGWPSDHHQLGSTVAIDRWLDGPVLAQAGDARRPLWRPARRFLGRRPKRARGDSRGLGFPTVRHEQ
jgi:hypothetical protein